MYAPIYTTCKTDTILLIRTIQFARQLMKDAGCTDYMIYDAIAPARHLYRSCRLGYLAWLVDLYG